jgi:hypothetical protein
MLLLELITKDKKWIIQNLKILSISQSADKVILV